MRNSYLVLLITFLAASALSAQVKIGDNPQNIDPSSVLELESTDKVLVITRVSTTQMNAIVPLEGALCFNTDLQSVHYYDGTQWVNIGGGSGAGGPLTADAIVNTQPTIVITPTATGDNLEVAPNSIRSEQIVDGGVNGVDIQDGSIGPGKLQDFSITQEKLSENSVGAFALDNDSFGVSAFNNDAGYITAGDITSVSADPGNAVSSGSDGGAFYDDTDLLMDVMDNAADIALDDDQSSANEIQNPTLTGSVIGLTDTAGTIDIGPLISAGGSDDQNLTLTGNVIEIEDGNTIDLTTILGSGGTDNQNLTLTGNVIEIEDGNTIDLTPILSTGGTDNQNLTLTGNMIEIEDGNTIDLTPILGGGGTDDQTAAEVTYDPATSGLTATNTQAAIDEIAAAGGSDDQTAAEVTYDPATSGLTATDTQAAIDEIVAAGGSDDQTAVEVTYDPTTSGLTATDTQAAIDEIAAAGGSDDQTAAEVTYDPITSGLTATDAQAAIDEIAAAGSNEQDIALNSTTNAIDLLEDDGTTISSSVLLDGTTIEAFDNGTAGDASDDVIRIKPAADLPTPASQMLITNDTGAVEWAQISGTENSVFYAGPNGLPITVEENANPRDDRGFYWDPNGRDLGGTFQFGALYIGLEPGNAQTDEAKVHIADNFPGLTYALQLQNFNSSASRTTGILFSTVNDAYGKGSLIFDSQGANGIGDFHFLQNNNANTNLPVITDKAFTVRNNKDIVVYGGIEIDGTGPGFGLGTTGQVLSSTGTGVQWVDNGNTTLNDGNIFVGNTADIATGVVMSGDALIDNTGAITIQPNVIETGEILNATILAEDLSDMGAANNEILKWNGTIWEPAADEIGDLTLNDGNIFVGNTADTATGVVMSGDAVIDNTGAIAIQANVIETSEILNATILDEDIALGAISGGVGGVIADNSITAADITIGSISGGLGGSIAANSITQIDLDTDSVGADQILSDAVSSDEIDDDSIEAIDINTGAVTSDEILDGTILDIDIAAGAAIDGSKINPVFPIQINAGAGITSGADILLNGNMVVADYVFQKYFSGNSALKESYNFRTLEEIEIFVKKNNHLPGIKSAEQVKKEKVWNLSDSNMQNLEKIEELFLHTIEQEKKIKTLKSENHVLREELKSLQNSVEEIKTLLKTKE